MKIYIFADMINTWTVADVFESVEILTEAELREKLRKYLNRLPSKLKDDYELDYITSPVNDIVDAFNEAGSFDDKFYFCVKEIEINITTED